VREKYWLYNAGEHIPEITVVNLFKIKLALSMTSFSFSSQLLEEPELRSHARQLYFFRCILYSIENGVKEKRKSEGNRIRNYSQIRTVYFHIYRFNYITHFWKASQQKSQVCILSFSVFINTTRQKNKNK